MKTKKMAAVILITLVVSLPVVSSALFQTRSAYAHEGVLQTTTNTKALFLVRDFGASGDGKALDSPAVNRAIDAAAAARLWRPSPQARSSTRTPGPK